MNYGKYEGQLCRMLEEPVPLTPDAEMPCLTRLIQDDSRMGMFNRDTKPSRLSDFYLVARIVSNNIVVDEFMESDYNRFEIIGTPVAEGSEDWAWYQMMQGEKINHAELSSQRFYANKKERFYAIKKGCDYCAFYENDGNEVCTSPISKRTRRTYGEFIEYSKSWGILSWQIYKEPELKYKVGDYLEVDENGKIVHCYIVPKSEANQEISGLLYDLSTPKRWVGCIYRNKPNTHIIRKLKPSEVQIKIGCLSGTVKDLSYVEDGRFWFIGGKTERCPGGMHGILYDEMLDTQTRELVEGLLKAQEKGE
jgi:hypothetical protein